MWFQSGTLLINIRPSIILNDVDQRIRSFLQLGHIASFCSVVGTSDRLLRYQCFIAIYNNSWLLNASPFYFGVR